jgi:hypothetical protein
MPIISSFYGVSVKMYRGLKEHNPPHIHAEYQGQKACFDIRTGERMNGSLPNTQAQMVSVWINLRKDELMEDWIMAQKNEKLNKVKPLK